MTLWFVVIWLHLVALVILNLVRLFEQWVLIHTQDSMSLWLMVMV